VEKETSISLGNKVGLIGALIVLIGFFLPWLQNNDVSISGYGAVFDPEGKVFGSKRYLALALPLSAILFLLLLFVKGANPGIKKLLKFVPLIAIILGTCFVFYKIGARQREQLFDHAGSFFKLIGIGIWLTLAGAIVMLFHRDK
jgi:uncharacterized membrane protein